MFAAELGGNLEAIVINALQASEEAFDPDYHTEDKATEDAAMLYKMGQGKWGTDEKGLFKFFCSAPPEHLKKLNPIYADKHGYTLLKVMEKELGESFLSFVLCRRLSDRPLMLVASSTR